MVHLNIFELLGSNLIKKNEKKATKCKLHIEMLSGFGEKCMRELWFSISLLCN